MSESAGRVLMIPKGTYSPTTTYDPLDAVKYEQNSYVCKQTSRGNLPTNTTYWQPLTDVTADEIPTEGSTNLVQSGGVYSALRTINQTLTNQVTDISAVMGKNGAKNKEPFDIDVVKALNTTGTWTGNSYALNGITFAFADDGKVTVSGTASALCSINISGNYDLNGDYIITGCPSGGGISTYSLRIYDSSATAIADDIGEGISFTANNLANCRTNIIVRKDEAISTPIVFAPMIRDSKDPDATYQPYAKTNRELTEENEILIGSLIGDQTFSSNRITKKNGIVTINAAFQADKDYNGFTKFVEIPSGFRSLNDNPIGFLFNDTQGAATSVTSFSTGKIQASAKITAGEYYRMAMTYIIT